MTTEQKLASNVRVRCCCRGYGGSGPEYWVVDVFGESVGDFPTEDAAEQKAERIRQAICEVD